MKKLDTNKQYRNCRVFIQRTAGNASVHTEKADDCCHAGRSLYHRYAVATRSTPWALRAHHVEWNGIS